MPPHPIETLAEVTSGRTARTPTVADAEAGPDADVGPESDSGSLAGAVAGLFARL